MDLNSKDAIMSGICADYARYANIDPIIVRTLLIIATVALGIFPLFFLYLIISIIKQD